MARRRTPPNPTPRAVGYLRVSTTEQADEGVSIEAQAAALRAYCTLRGLELVELVTDAGVSAGRPLHERAGGRRVLELVAGRQVGAVVGFKLDRLFRCSADCLTVTRAWDAAGVSLHLVDLGGQAVDTSSAMGRFFLTVMAGAAELERNQIRERTSAALAHLRAQGVRMGGEALGWSYADATDETGRRVVEDVRHEAETVARILALRDGGAGLAAIARTLTGEARPTKRGGAWHASTVRAVLVREGAL